MTGQLRVWIVVLAFLAVGLIGADGAISQAQEATEPVAPAEATAVDLFAYPALEVTQGVQTYKPSGNVGLVAGKRTFVFFYARVLDGGGLFVTTAELKAENDGNIIILKPLNNGGTVELNDRLPNRYHGTRQFRFELPAGFRDGETKLTATLNPGNKSPVEADTSNNTGSKTVTFTNVPALTMYVFDVQYKVFGHGSRVFSLNDYASIAHREMFVNWLKRAYPLQSVPWYKKTLYIGKWAVVKGKLWVTCITPNISMALWYSYNLGEFPTFTRAYGMVADSGGYMRGCAEIAGKKVATGPTGPDSRGWDTDESYGDWYGGHEMAHLFDRDHTSNCDAPIPRDPYPYPGSSISPRTEAYVNVAQEWGDAVAGVKIDGGMTNPEIYDASWNDQSSYCSKRWPSDFSYKKFLDQFTTQSTAATVSAPVAPMDRLSIMGAIDDATGTIMLSPVYLIPDAEEFPGHQDGPYAVVLRNAQGGELLRYPFTLGEPGTIDAASTREQRDGLDPEDPTAQMSAPATIAELVPNVAGVERIDIEGPGGSLLHTVTAGSAAPVVTVEAPLGGVRIPPNQESLEVRWNANDPDNDPLTFLVEYSPDGGKRWHLFAMGITDTVVAIPAENLIAGNEALVRVSASDGVHTGMDTPDSPFTVLNHPPTVEILPVGNSGGAVLLAADAATNTVPVFAVGQTVTFEALGYDVEEGSLDAQLAWASNIDGPLGTGALLSLADMSTGVHTLTVTADDGDGGIAKASAKVEIVAELDDLPPTPDGLAATPGFVYFANTETTTQTVVYLSNQKPGSVIQWNAAVDKPWVKLSATSGDTPAELVVSLAPDIALPDGLHEATLTLTSPQLPDAKLDLPVAAEMLLEMSYLPLVNR
jgi:hypothetical protein